MERHRFISPHLRANVISQQQARINRLSNRLQQASLPSNSTADDSSFQQRDNSQSLVDCAWCLDKHPQSKVVVIQHIHVCHDCIISRFQKAVESEENYPLKWADVELQVKDYKHILPVQLARHFRAKEKEYRTPVDERIYCRRPQVNRRSQGQIFGGTDDLEDIPQSRISFQECGNFIGRVKKLSTDSAEKVEEKQVKVNCKSCRHPYCLVCAQPYVNGGHQCSGISPAREENEAEVGVVGKDFQYCPSTYCRRKLYLADGCNHMTCNCGQSLCYVCGQPADERHWDRGRAGCSRYNHPSASNANWDDPADVEDFEVDEVEARAMELGEVLRGHRARVLQRQQQGLPNEAHQHQMQMMMVRRQETLRRQQEQAQQQRDVQPAVFGRERRNAVAPTLGRITDSWDQHDAWLAGRMETSLNVNNFDAQVMAQPREHDTVNAPQTSSNTGRRAEQQRPTPTLMNQQTGIPRREAVLAQQEQLLRLRSQSAQVAARSTRPAHIPGSLPTTQQRTNEGAYSQWNNPETVLAQMDQQYRRRSNVIGRISAPGQLPTPPSYSALSADEARDRAIQSAFSTSTTAGIWPVQGGQQPLTSRVNHLGNGTTLSAETQSVHPTYGFLPPNFVRPASLQMNPVNTSPSPALPGPRQDNTIPMQTLRNELRGLIQAAQDQLSTTVAWMALPNITGHAQNIAARLVVTQWAEAVATAYLFDQRQLPGAEPLVHDIVWNAWNVAVQQQREATAGADADVDMIDA